jgi:cellulose synthase/poly-beta-1,6-N-acetylglucosamine synthase-like glycosyltransferase
LIAASLACLYTIILIGMSIMGFQSLVLSLLYLVHRRNVPRKPPPPEIWPHVTVQLPTFNERFVVERLIDGICSLDYPRNALTIQVLDDSTDGTTELARKRVALHRARGVDITLLHRENRLGYKAGALAAGLQTAPGDLIAIFDADFIPPADFLRQTIPYFTSNPDLGMLQTRWEHLNPDENLLTLGQALSIDTRFVVIQTARNRSGLLLNFNGSGGIWRRACIEDAGGWDRSNLTEDLDLSYRAQMRGWQMLYLPGLTVPGEIPPSMSVYKLQQHRWSQGGIQTLLKLIRSLWQAPLTLAQRVAGVVHLASYLWHPLMLAYILISLPILLLPGFRLPSMIWLLPAGLGAPLLLLLSQWGMHPHWKRRLAYFPVLIFLGVGLCLNNTLAVLKGFSHHHTPFHRTPKFNRKSPSSLPFAQDYTLPVNRTVWGEFALGGYALGAFILALGRLPMMAPTLGLIALSFGFVSGMGLLERRNARIHPRTGGGSHGVVDHED